ncbi:dihydrodipicolinate synthase family protein [Streptomyces sp. NBC_01808]|uniref:dihydrodipicolinate synthase family protein n=1 Tax=Streptomyces sp. NBC_01808 TaxID=2975947 RepID=UPI002DDC3ECE|nr:dihydrodipicolinate synthase family protein [Streptomyces sp. NBC_01808]WSA35999.1 dihydrodipicolinate synthase family protein [Streptomyces sp. NBC_01808]
MPVPKLHGIIAPVVLPMTKSGGVDAPSLECHLQHLFAAGIHGLWMNGTTGEFHALDAEERAAAVRVAAETAAGRAPVVAHVGDAATGLAVRHARAAVAAGADQVSVIAPYFTEFTREELRDHYRRIADAVGFPIYAYHMPRLTKIGLTADCVLQLAQEGVLAGIKDSDGDLTWFRQLVRRAARTGVEFRCFTGDSSISDVSLLVGAAGATSSVANVTPRHLVAMYDAARAQDWVRVRRMQDRLEDLLEAMRLARRAPTLSSVVSTYKFVLATLGRIEADHAAAPLAPLDEDEKARLVSTVVPLVRELESAAHAKERGDDT